MKITSAPTRQDAKKFQRKKAEIAIKYSTGLFQGSDDYGHMHLVLGEAKYRTLIGNEALTYQVSEKLGAVDTTVPNTAGELLRMRRIAEHEQKIEDYEIFRVVMAGLNKHILFEVDEQYLQALK